MTMMIIFDDFENDSSSFDSDNETSNRAEKNLDSLFHTKRGILQQYVWLVCCAAQCASHKTNISQETMGELGIKVGLLEQRGASGKDKYFEF